MSSQFRLVSALAASLLTQVFAPTAHAAAWTLPSGDAQIITTAITTRSDTVYGPDGKTASAPVFSKQEVYVLAEVGVTDQITALLSPSYSRVTVDDAALEGNGLGYVELGLRGRLAGGDRSPISLQGTVRIPGSKRNSNLAQLAQQGTEFDVRALKGWTLKVGNVSGFADLQGGFRWRNGGPADEWHVDATIGIRPTSRLQVLGQTFTVVSEGAGGPGYTSNNYTKISTSAVYEISRHVSIQGGVAATVRGRNALRERGLFVALWWRN